MINSRRNTRLDECASKFNPASVITAERWEQLQKEHIGFLRLKQVVDLTGRSKSSIYSGARAGTFPMWVNIGANSTAWKKADVMAWIESRPYACETA